MTLGSARTARLLAMLTTAAAIAAIDQWTKLLLTTPEWAYHHRSERWFAGSCLILACSVALVLVPSRPVAFGAGLLGGGILGNLLSASIDGLYVPNPLMLGEQRGIAFNAADVCILAGNATLMVGLSVVVIRSRDRLLERRVALERAIRRRR